MNKFLLHYQIDTEANASAVKPKAADLAADQNPKYSDD